MEHMKKIIMVIVIIGLVASAAFMIRRNMMDENGEVKIQSFCLGLCGKDKNGNGVGFGIGASDKGPLLVAGPWGDNNSSDEENLDNNNEEEDDEDYEEEN